MPAKNNLAKLAAQSVRPREPLWHGPQVDGITYSLLCQFLNCRERFRVRVIEGLAPHDTFNHKIEFGSMWHACEEGLAVDEDAWKGCLIDYANALCKRYSMQQEQVEHWYRVCKAQFPLYVDYWQKHPDVTNRTPLLQEEKFRVPYKLPSGRTVLLRGKWDSVDLIKGDIRHGTATTGIWLQENKTKGDIREGLILKQLRFDLQTMLYMTALWEEKKDPKSNLFREKSAVKDGGKLTPLWGTNVPILGVRYNVVRRPLSGGKGTIVRHKPSKSNPAGESADDFYKRVEQYIKDEPETYFMRWKVEITAKDVETFRRTCLDPILENLCYWWDYINQKDPAPEEYGYGIHYRHPYGVYNALNEGGATDLDDYLDTGSEVGLRRIGDLFPELT